MRVSVVGDSGSGKSTLARSLAATLTVPLLELDSVYHQPNWQPLPESEFQHRVTDFIAADAWVVDGNYSAVRPLVWARAEVVVWFDLPRVFVFRRLLARTLRRGLGRTELWNGNRESLRNLFRGGEENILLWSWRHHAKYRARYAPAQTDPAFGYLHFVRIGRPPDATVAFVLAALRKRNPNVGRTGG